MTEKTTMGDLNLLNALFDQENFLLSFDKDDFVSKRIDKDVSLISFSSLLKKYVNLGHNVLFISQVGHFSSM